METQPKRFRPAIAAPQVSHCGETRYGTRKGPCSAEDVRASKAGSQCGCQAEGESIAGATAAALGGPVATRPASTAAEGIAAAADGQTVGTAAAAATPGRTAGFTATEQRAGGIEAGQRPGQGEGQGERQRQTIGVTAHIVESPSWGRQDSVVKGQIKGAAGTATGNDELRTEGKTDQAVGKVKQVAETAVDKIEHAAKKVRK